MIAVEGRGKFALIRGHAAALRVRRLIAARAIAMGVLVDRATFNLPGMVSFAPFLMSALTSVPSPGLSVTENSWDLAAAGICACAEPMTSCAKIQPSRLDRC